MKKILSLLLLCTFATAAFAQITLDPPAAERRYKNHRGAEKPRKSKHKG
jgi:hypothetical protein